MQPTVEMSHILIWACATFEVVLADFRIGSFNVADSLQLGQRLEGAVEKVSS
jgi:hypothetical protein